MEEIITALLGIGVSVIYCCGSFVGLLACIGGLIFAIKTSRKMDRKWEELDRRG